MTMFLLFKWLTKMRSANKYFKEVVLNHSESINALKLWLSAGRSEYMIKLRWLSSPHIWMLSGQYLLDDAKNMVLKQKETKGEAGMTSVTIAALTGIPVGGSIGLTNSTEITANMQIEGRRVWAARYHLLDTKYIQVVGNMPALPTIIRLYPDILSKGHVRGTNDESTVDVSIADGKEGHDEYVLAEREQGYDPTNSSTEIRNANEERDRYRDDLRAAINTFGKVIEQGKKCQAKNTEGVNESDSE